MILLKTKTKRFVASVSHDPRFSKLWWVDLTDTQGRLSRRFCASTKLEADAIAVREEAWLNRD